MGVSAQRVSSFVAPRPIGSLVRIPSHQDFCQLFIRGRGVAEIVYDVNAKRKSLPGLSEPVTSSEIIAADPWWPPGVVQPKRIASHIVL